MTSTSSDNRRSQMRTYDRTSSVVFLKTKESFGGLSNMASGFPLLVNGIRIRTSEALYQACRFPHRPDVQHRIIDERSPMTAKMRSKPYRHDSRRDWDEVRVNVMRWCLRVKLAQNWNVFSKLLLNTGERSIVEHSRKDNFWGAKPADERTLVGMNVLGRLLMELREAIKSEPRENLLRVAPLPIADFLLGGRPIEPVTVGTIEEGESVHGPSVRLPQGRMQKSIGVQLPLTRASNIASGPSREDTTEWAGDGCIGHLEPYPAYKPSGVEWLGAVPEHWDVRRVKSLSLVKRGASPRPIADPKYFDGHGEYAWVRIADVTASSRYLERTTQRLSVLGQSLSVPLEPGTLFLSIAGSVGKPIITRIKCCIHDGFVYFPQFTGDVEFLCRIFACGAPFARLGKLGTQLNLNTDTVGNISLGWPPSEEQAAIVRFLDHADRRIRRYLRAKQKLITLLEEQKQAIIHQAVTGQIDVRTGQPFSAYKDSGVEWLGQMPAHWGITRGKRLFSLRKDLALPDDLQLSATQAYGVIPQAEFEQKVGRRVVKVFMHLEKRRHVEKDDFVISMRSFQGGLERAWASGCIRSSYVVLKPESDADVGFFTYLFKSHGYIRALQATASFIRDGQDLNFRNFCLVDLPAVRLQEQKAIAEFLDTNTASTATAIEGARAQVAFLREFRTRLIADVVTGKLDVREAAARLPDEDEEPEPFDEGGALTTGEEDLAEVED